MNTHTASVKTVRLAPNMVTLLNALKDIRFQCAQDLKNTGDEQRHMRSTSLAVLMRTLSEQAAKDGFRLIIINTEAKRVIMACNRQGRPPKLSTATASDDKCSSVVDDDARSDASGSPDVMRQRRMSVSRKSGRAGTSMRCGCRMRVNINYHSKMSAWRVTSFETNHNHSYGSYQHREEGTSQDDYQTIDTSFQMTQEEVRSVIDYQSPERDPRDESSAAVALAELATRSPQTNLDAKAEPSPMHLPSILNMNHLNVQRNSKEGYHQPHCGPYSRIFPRLASIASSIASGTSSRPPGSHISLPVLSHGYSQQGKSSNIKHSHHGQVFGNGQSQHGQVFGNGQSQHGQVFGNGQSQHGKGFGSVQHHPLYHQNGRHHHGSPKSGPLNTPPTSQQSTPTSTPTPPPITIDTSKSIRSLRSPNESPSISPTSERRRIVLIRRRPSLLKSSASNHSSSTAVNFYTPPLSAGPSPNGSSCSVHSAGMNYLAPPPTARLVHDTMQLPFAFTHSNDQRQCYEKNDTSGGRKGVLTSPPDSVASKSLSPPYPSTMQNNSGVMDKSSLKSIATTAIEIDRYAMLHSALKRVIAIACKKRGWTEEVLKATGAWVNQYERQMDGGSNATVAVTDDVQASEGQSEEDAGQPAAKKARLEAEGVST